MLNKISFTWQALASCDSFVSFLDNLLATDGLLPLVRPSTAIGGNGGVNLLFDTVDVLFGTVDREGVGNEARANLLLLLPLWTA